MRVILCAWRIVRHPAFWIPVLAAFCGDLYVHGLALEGRAIGSDGWGYYLQLPAIFIHGDPHLVFLNSPDLPQDVLQYRSPDQHWQGLSAHGAGYGIGRATVDGQLACEARLLFVCADRG